MHLGSEIHKQVDEPLALLATPWEVNQRGCACSGQSSLCVRSVAVQHLTPLPTGGDPPLHIHLVDAIVLPSTVDAEGGRSSLSLRCTPFPAPGLPGRDQ